MILKKLQKKLKTELYIHLLTTYIHVTSLERLYLLDFFACVRMLLKMINVFGM